jgi:hypothetical protein
MVVRLQQLFVASLGLPSSSLCNGQTVSAKGAFPAHGLHFGLEYDVSESLHPSAPHDLPVFITAPGDTDVLMVVVGAVLILAVLAVGNLYLHLHTLPERMAHRSQKHPERTISVELRQATDARTGRSTGDAGRAECLGAAACLLPPRRGRNNASARRGPVSGQGAGVDRVAPDHGPARMPWSCTIKSGCGSWSHASFRLRRGDIAAA